MGRTKWIYMTIRQLLGWCCYLFGGIVIIFALSQINTGFNTYADDNDMWWPWSGVIMVVLMLPPFLLILLIGCKSTEMDIKPSLFFIGLVTFMISTSRIVYYEINELALWNEQTTPPLVWQNMVAIIASIIFMCSPFILKWKIRWG